MLFAFIFDTGNTEILSTTPEVIFIIIITGFERHSLADSTDEFVRNLFDQHAWIYREWDIVQIFILEGVNLLVNQFLD